MSELYAELTHPALRTKEDLKKLTEHMHWFTYYIAWRWLKPLTKFDWAFLWSQSGKVVFIHFMMLLYHSKSTST